MGYGAHVAAPHDEVRFARQHGGGQLRDVGARVLVVGVGADDDVGPPGQRFTISATAKASCAARPRLRLCRTTQSTPWARATLAVSSLEPSSTTNVSSWSAPGISRGSSASVAGSVADSL